MDNEIQGAIAVILSVGVAVALVMGTGLWINHLNEKAFIAGGYSRETLPGACEAQWVKK